MRLCGVFVASGRALAKRSSVSSRRNLGRHLLAGTSRLPCVECRVRICCGVNGFLVSLRAAVLVSADNEPVFHGFRIHLYLIGQTDAENHRPFRPDVNITCLLDLLMCKCYTSVDICKPVHHPMDFG